VLLSQIQKEADMHLSKIRQTATKNGIREWRMEAESASLLKEKQTMLLVNPNVEVFMTDGDNVHLTADEGIIYTASNRLSVSGNVVAQTRLYQFRTESVVYDPDTRELRADTPVKVSSKSATLKAKAMTIKLTTRITCFEGGVEGTISEDLRL
jgi:LPS export ABC transporter protein LptC